jgi:hypothetical protein
MRSKPFLSLFGPIRLPRAYYYCGRCGHGLAPFDHQACISTRGLTLAAEEVVGMTGLLTDSFAEAAEKILPKLSGLHVGESTVERVTEDLGGQVGDWLDEGYTFGDDVCWDWRPDAQGRRVAYVGIDATGVRQQGPGGKKAEGRMPLVAMVFNPPLEQPATETTRSPTADAGAAAEGASPVPRTGSDQAGTAAVVPPAVPANGSEQARSAAAGRPKRPYRRLTAKEKADRRMQVHYLAGLYTLPSLGLLLRRQGCQVGMEKADLWLGLSDGGNGLEDFLRTNFNRPNLVVILDFYHPASRLEELTKLWYPGEEEKAKALAEQWCVVLKKEGGEAMLQRLRALPPPRGQAAKTKYAELLVYLENHKHKMNYPEYVKEGWYIGSGPVESACKTVVGQRLKLAGMRWGQEGTDHVCHLRALFKSDKEQWQAFWDRRMKKRTNVYQQN